MAGSHQRDDDLRTSSVFERSRTFFLFFLFSFSLIIHRTRRAAFAKVFCYIKKYCVRDAKMLTRNNLEENSTVDFA